MFYNSDVLPTIVRPAGKGGWIATPPPLDQPLEYMRFLTLQLLKKMLKLVQAKPKI